MSGEDRIERVRAVLLQSLKPQFLSVEDESHGHGRGGAVTHLRVVVVADEFQGQTRVSRQRRVHDLLKNELQTGLHALALRTLTPGEWQAEGGVDRLKSAPCYRNHKRNV